MRKIEVQMNNAISNSTNFKSANTVVKFDSDSDVSSVYLHGNKIAEVSADSLQMFDGDHQTTTTKSRLNAILKDCGLRGEYVFQKNYKWFYNKFVGDINGQSVYKVVEFESGMFA